MVISALTLLSLAIRGLLLLFEVIALGLAGVMVSQASESISRFNYNAITMGLVLIFVGVTWGIDILGDGSLAGTIMTSLDMLSFIFVLAKLASLINSSNNCQVALGCFDCHEVGCSKSYETIALLWLTWIFSIPVVVWDILFILGVVKGSTSNQPGSGMRYVDPAVPQTLTEPQPEPHFVSQSAFLEPSMQQKKL